VLTEHSPKLRKFRFRLAAVCYAMTGKSFGSASIAPFLADRGRPPSPTRAALSAGPVPHTVRCGPARSTLIPIRWLSSHAAMDCIVTGGAGFIGSNLVDALLERGDRVTVIDDLSTGKRENLAAALAQ